MFFYFLPISCFLPCFVSVHYMCNDVQRCAISLQASQFCFEFFRHSGAGARGIFFFPFDIVEKHHDLEKCQLIGTTDADPIHDIRRGQRPFWPQQRSRVLRKRPQREYPPHCRSTFIFLAHRRPKNPTGGAHNARTPFYTRHPRIARL